MVTKQEELIHHAFRNPSLREQEREEIERLTREFLKNKKNKIEQVPFGKYGKPEVDGPVVDLKSKKAFYNEVNITGQKFGRLTAIKRCPTRAMASYWVFQCDCGYTGTFERRKVMDGMRTCCDACKKLKVKLVPGHAIDLTGKKFNSLTVIKRAEVIGASGAMWECRCDCGETRIAKAHSLTNSITKSCHKCARSKFKAKRKVDFGGRNG